MHNKLQTLTAKVLRMEFARNVLKDLSSISIEFASQLILLASPSIKVMDSVHHAMLAIS